MATLEKWAIEIGVAIALVGILVGWFLWHNASERREGAQVCIQSTTEVKQAAVAHVAVDEKANHDQIKTEVDSYGKKLTDLQSANDDLSRRLSNALRASAVRNTGSAAGNCPTDAGLPSSKSEAEQGSSAATIAADVKSVLDACDANQLKVESANNIYNGVRDRALAAAAKPR